MKNKVLVLILGLIMVTVLGVGIFTKAYAKPCSVVCEQCIAQCQECCKNCDCCKNCKENCADCKQDCKLQGCKSCKKVNKETQVTQEGCPLHKKQKS